MLAMSMKNIGVSEITYSCIDIEILYSTSIGLQLKYTFPYGVYHTEYTWTFSTIMVFDPHLEAK